MRRPASTRAQTQPVSSWDEWRPIPPAWRSGLRSCPAVRPHWPGQPADRPYDRSLRFSHVLSDPLASMDEARLFHVADGRTTVFGDISRKSLMAVSAFSTKLTVCSPASARAKPRVCSKNEPGGERDTYSLGLVRARFAPSPVSADRSKRCVAGNMSDPPLAVQEKEHDGRVVSPGTVQRSLKVSLVRQPVFRPQADQCPPAR